MPQGDRPRMGEKYGGEIGQLDPVIRRLEEEIGWCLCVSAKCEIWLAVSERQHGVHPIESYLWDTVYAPYIKLKQEESRMDYVYPSSANHGWEPASSTVSDEMPNYHTGNPKKRRGDSAPVRFPDYTRGKTISEFNGQPIKRGEDTPGAKLTYQEVDDIKELLRDGKLSTYEIADMYKVSKSTIVGIRKGETWSDGTTIEREPVWRAEERRRIVLREVR